jgi:hypothetical protein
MLTFIGFIGAILIAEGLVLGGLLYPLIAGILAGGRRSISHAKRTWGISIGLKFLGSAMTAYLMIELATHVGSLTPSYGWLAASACFFFFFSKADGVYRARKDAGRKQQELRSQASDFELLMLDASGTEAEMAVFWAWEMGAVMIVTALMVTYSFFAQSSELSMLSGLKTFLISLYQPGILRTLLSIIGWFACVKYILIVPLLLAVPLAMFWKKTEE